LYLQTSSLTPSDERGNLVRKDPKEACVEKSRRLKRGKGRPGRLHCLFTRPLGHIGEKYQIQRYPGVWSQRRCVICHAVTTRPHWWWHDLEGI